MNCQKVILNWKSNTLFKKEEKNYIYQEPLICKNTSKTAK